MSSSDRRSRVERANSPIGRALRYVGLLLGIVVGWRFGAYLHERTGDGGPGEAYALLFAASLGALFFLATPYLTIGFFRWLRQEIRRLSAADLVAGAVGLLVGGLISTLLAWPISLLPDPFGQLLPAIAAIAICSLAVVAAVTNKRDLLALLGREPAVEPASEARARPRVLLDTSVIIDGRIVDLAATGFLMADLVVPAFVLRELQQVADSEDLSRRERGRRGLQVLEQLRHDEDLRLELSDLDAPEEPDVDGKLVRLARTHGFTVLTGDQNLERIGNLHGVKVLNIHQLSSVMRPPLTPGEVITLKIVQAGREYGQGVGFLDDGTMVVVEDGRALLGRDVDVVVTRTLRTGAGRMAFAQPVRKEEAV